MTKHKAQPCNCTKVAVPTIRSRSARLLTHLIVFPILAYQWFIAPLIGDCCRFQPCCSTYAKEVIIKYGANKAYG
jgi:putative component of membrane protein insertase Oxa1/YidC/SpoIIIJ protein YidD